MNLNTGRRHFFQKSLAIGGSAMFARPFTGRALAGMGSGAAGSNETLKTLQSLRTIHGNFTDQEIPSNQIDEILSAGVRAANASALQRYSIIVVREYLEIEKVHMGERLDYTFQVDTDVEMIRIPPMVIQMLVENAVKHGLSPKREGGKVSVNISKLDNAVKLEVEDTGVGFEPGQPQNGFGLKSIQQRLQLLYNNAKFDIIKPASGTLVRIVLPYAV